MKILHITTNAGGGAGRAAVRLHLALLKRGVDSNILFLKDKVDKIPNSFTYSDYENKNIFKIKDFTHRLNSKIISGFNKFEVISLATTPFDLLKVPIVKEADIIHFHWVSKFLDYRSFFTKIYKPVVWTLHDMVPFSPGYHYLSGFNLQKNKGRLDRNFKRKQAALQNFEKLSVVAPTQWLADISKKGPLFSKYPHFVFRNLLERKTFYKRNNKEDLRKKYGFKANDKVILYIAENINDKRKGIDLFLEMMDNLLDKDYKILLIGSGSVQKEHKNIIIMGKISDDNVLAELYSLSDVFVISSKEDNYPNTILESLACGTPVVGFDNSGIKEMILHKKTGYLAKAFDKDDFINGIDFVMSNYEKLSANTDDFIKENCNEDYICNQFINLYNSNLR